ncbi:MAG: DUF4136 domain-containing protein [Gammaproteobacteria bacterium]
MFINLLLVVYSFIRPIAACWCCALLLIVSCASTTNLEKDEAMPSVDISRFGTYGWIEEARYDSEQAERLLERFPLVDEIVTNTVDSLLQAKGYIKSSSNPGFRVTYLLAVEDRQVWTRNQRRVREFREGSLILDFIDPAADKIIWSGVEEDLVEEERTPRQRRRVVERGLQRILERVPASDEAH